MKTPEFNLTKENSLTQINFRMEIELERKIQNKAPLLAEDKEHEQL